MLSSLVDREAEMQETRQLLPGWLGGDAFEVYVSDRFAWLTAEWTLIPTCSRPISLSWAGASRSPLRPAALCIALIWAVAQQTSLSHKPEPQTFCVAHPLLSPTFVRVQARLRLSTFWIQICLSASMKTLAQLFILQPYVSPLFSLYSILQLSFAPKFLPAVLQHFLLLPLQQETLPDQIEVVALKAFYYLSLT